MEFLRHDDVCALRALVRQHVFQPGVSTRCDLACFLVNLGEAIVIGQHRVWVEATVLTDGGPFTPRDFLGMSWMRACDLANRTYEIKVVFVPQQWDVLAHSEGPVVILGAMVSEGHKVLDMTDAKSAASRFCKAISTSEAEEITFAEMFCEGYGGWSQTIQALSCDAKPMSCQWAIDNGSTCCSTYQKNYTKDVVGQNPQRCWNHIRAQKGCMFAPYVLVQAAIEGTWWIIFAGRISTEAVVFSALCLPHGTDEVQGCLVSCV